MLVLVLGLAPHVDALFCSPSCDAGHGPLMLLSGAARVQLLRSLSVKSFKHGGQALISSALL